MVGLPRVSLPPWILPLAPLGVLALLAAAVPAALPPLTDGGDAVVDANPVAVPATTVAPFALGECPSPAGTRTEVVASERPVIRSAAQRGLAFLAQDTVRWQRQNQCYGCHVQAVTLKAMAVGEHHQYDVDREALAEVVDGLLNSTGGSRTKPGMGLHHGSGSYLSASRSLGAAGLARYDEWIDDKLRDDLLTNAELLLGMQTDAGHVRNDYTHAPVAIGEVQDTVLAMAAWNQAWARTADDRWLTAVAVAEDWLHTRVAGWNQGLASDVQEVNYVLMGLHEAGTGATEPVVATALSTLAERQNTDGGWGLQAGAGSDAYATGQTLYTLRLYGQTDGDTAVRKGTDWLVQHQDASGGWSHSGRARAEAMWGVLGLVSVDVLSVSVNGLKDGQHVAGMIPVSALAVDNQGGGVQRVELFVDDLPAGGGCGATMESTLDASILSPGAHLIDVIATNGDGKQARRRFEVYAGPVYLTRVGSRWDDGGTRFSLRDIAPEGTEHQVRVRIRAEDGEETITTIAEAGSQGPLSLRWAGPEADKVAENGRYVAEVAFLAADGSVVQEVEHAFVHNTEAWQRNNFGQVAGKLSFGDGDDVAGAKVELVDEIGNVVGAAVSTRSGQYRFKNVGSGNYRVRVKKEGFSAPEQEVEAIAGEEAQADALVE